MNEELKKKLGNLIEDGAFEDGAMLLGPTGMDSAMAAILQTIDTTILPRVVTFSVGDAAVTLNLGGRRLRACLSASDELDAPQDLMGQTLSSDDADAVKEIGTLLERLVAPQGETLKMQRADGLSASDPGEAGVAMATLAELWGADPDAQPPGLFAQFVDLLGPAFVASAELEDGAVTNPRGEAAVVVKMDASVIEQHSALTSELSATGKDTSADQIVVAEGLLPDGLLTVFVALADTQGIVAARAETYPDIASAWGRI